jgi:soluble lytic murein transglycosylase-like protein
MSPRPALTVVAAILISVAVPAAASAQIYAWRDAQGHLVLSDRPKDPAARTFAVSASTTMRVTRPVAMRRSTAYDALIEEHATANGVSADLVRAVIQAESAFNPRARSIKGAMGLMQLMPATAADYRVADPYNPAENIRAGVAYLKSLLTRYADSVELALAAYNAGPGAVEKYGTVPPYRETRNYVNKITRVAATTPTPTSTTLTAAAPSVRIYRTVETVDGREVVKYSNVRSAGAELVPSASRR